MKRIIFMTAMVLSLSACDQTKLQLRATEPQSNATEKAGETPKSDKPVTDTVKKDSISLR